MSRESSRGSSREANRESSREASRESSREASSESSREAIRKASREARRGERCFCAIQSRLLALRKRPQYAIHEHILSFLCFPVFFDVFRVFLFCVCVCVCVFCGNTA